MPPMATKKKNPQPLRLTDTPPDGPHLPDIVIIIIFLFFTFQVHPWLALRQRFCSHWSIEITFFNWSIKSSIYLEPRRDPSCWFSSSYWRLLSTGVWCIHCDTHTYTPCFYISYFLVCGGWCEEDGRGGSSGRRGRSWHRLTEPHLLLYSPYSLGCLARAGKFATSGWIYWYILSFPKRKRGSWSDLQMLNCNTCIDTPGLHACSYTRHKIHLIDTCMQDTGSYVLKLSWRRYIRQTDRNPSVRHRYPSDKSTWQTDKHTCTRHTSYTYTWQTYVNTYLIEGCL